MSMRWVAAAVLLIWAGSAGAFEVFQSNTNSAADRSPAVIPANGSASLNIWIDTNGPGTPNAGTASLACTGPGSTGDYSCSWELQLTTTGNVQITGFTPQQPGDYIVWHPTAFPSATLNMNGGNPAGNPSGELGELRIGTLLVQATGNSGQVLLSAGNSVDTQLNLVPVAGTPTLLGSVCAGQAPDSDCDGLQGAADNCPFYSQGSATDTDADGRGNECECTDQNGDGRNTVSDLVAINLAIFNPSRVTPLCDGNNDGDCNVQDIIAANLEIFSPTSTSTCARQPVAGP